MRTFRRGWHAVYAVLCVYLQSTITRADNVRFNHWGNHKPEATETRQGSTELASDEPSHGTGFPRKLIPIKAPRVDKNFAMYALPLEPDAEMLPAHYTGVKPPLVDHMELKYAESQISKVAPRIEPSKKSEHTGGARQVSEKQESRDEGGGEGYQAASSFEKGQKGDSLKKKKKHRYVEAGGKKKAHDNRENNSGRKTEQGGGSRRANYQKKNKDHVDHKTSGYRNVYHKDESKKDHDFYDNDDHGGHSKKHGRYNEKHIAIEGTFKKGAARDSGFDEAEIHKQGITGNSQADGESKGHEARRGYDGFFKNFQGFAKQTSRNEGKRFGFGQTKAR